VKVLELPRTAARGVIRLYQLLLSPFIGNQCRFHPSCSNYALEAIEVHGVLKGVWLSVRRLGRCQPFHAGGFDPVPPAQAATGHSARGSASLTREI